MNKRKYLLLGIFFVISVFFLPKQVTKAADKIEVIEINYLESSIILKAGSEDSLILFSDSKKKEWEEVPGTLDENKKIEMDISWITAGKNYTLNFKGDKTTEITTIVLPKASNKFAAKYQKATGTMAFTNPDKRLIEWRKNESSSWQTLNESTFSKELESLFSKGATLVFRLAPVNGNGTNAGLRASNEKKVTIPSKTAAPTITIDNAKLAISLKSGMAYRVLNDDNSTSEWIDIKKNEVIPLSVLAPDSMYNPLKTSENMVLQFRTNATSSKQVSNISTVEIPAQSKMLSLEEAGISLNYTGSTTLSIKIDAASPVNPFEYTVVEKDKELDLLKATWTTISTKEAVSVNSKKAPEASKIYLRTKSTGTQGEENYKLASNEINLTGETGVTYPANAKAEGVRKLVTTQGVCTKDNSNSGLSFVLYSPTKATVSSIKAHDEYSNTTLGSLSFKSTASENTDSNASSDKKYIITTKITSTHELDTHIDKDLFLDFTLDNGDEIKSTDESGIILFIHKASKINNPSGNKEYSTEFERLYMSTEEEDKASFKVRVDFGEEYLFEQDTNNAKSTKVAVSKIKFDGYELTASDYSITYDTEVNKDDKVISYAVIDIKVNNFEQNVAVNTFNEYEPLVIILNNGEIIDNKIKIKLVQTAKLLNAPIAYAITQGSLKETEQVVTTTAGGTEVVNTEDVISYGLEIELFDKNYPIAINDVTWNGISIFDSAKIQNGLAICYLSNKKLNKLTSASTTTNNVFITFSNGFVIKTGCKLTVIKGTEE